MSKSEAARGRLLRFLVAGTANTIATWIVYWALNIIFDYRVSYTVAFVMGIAFSYVLNATWVFSKGWGLRSALQFPAVYFAQYVSGLAALWVLVEYLTISREFALMIVTGTTVPLTFFMMRGIFDRAGARIS